MNYSCIKCGCTNCEADEFRATGGQIAKIFDIQNKRFYTVSCTNCGYTEIYKKNVSTSENVVDFLFGG